jgi:hypothetical protein
MRVLHVSECCLVFSIQRYCLDISRTEYSRENCHSYFSCARYPLHDCILPPWLTYVHKGLILCRSLFFFIRLAGIVPLRPIALIATFHSHI